MDYTFDEPDRNLRVRLRERISDAFPDGFPTITVDDPRPLEASHEFCRQLGEDGLLTLSWPKEYGGEDASLWAQVVIAEEMWGHGEPRGGQYYGVNWLGPTIMRFGTPAQKEQHLPNIARGRGLWAQGYSEPDAGSDLASLRLRATRVDGGWNLTGQKIWTSYGDYAEWCIVAARTDSSGSKHDGITVFLLPMDRPGIEVRPIRAVGGPHDFNEVFFEEAFAADDEVLGDVNSGWDVIRASLSFERVGTARYARSDRLLAEARATLLERDSPTNEHVIAEWVDALLNTRVARLLSYRAVAEREQDEQGSVSVLHSSVARIANTLTDQAATAVVYDSLSPASMVGHGEGEAPLGGEPEHEWRWGLAATVAAGTLEIQQILIARELLGRPERAPINGAQPS